MLAATASPRAGIWAQDNQSDSEATIASQQTQIAELQTEVASPRTPVATVEGDLLAETPAPDTSSGAVLFEADWSGGLGAWSNGPHPDRLPPSDWDAFDGMLVNDGTNDPGDSVPWLAAPFQAGEDADYAVEAEIQLVRTADTRTTGFGLVVRTSGRGGYWIRYSPNLKCALCRSGSKVFVAAGPDLGSALYRDGYDNYFVSDEFQPDDQWHTYRVEVDGNVIRFFFDDKLLLETIDNQYRAGGGVGLWASNSQITVRSFKVIRL